MSGRWVLLAALLVGCPERKEPARTEPAPAPAPASVEPAPAPPLPAPQNDGERPAPPGAIRMPAAPGPLPPFDRLTPRMKKADAVAALAGSSVSQIPAWRTHRVWGSELHFSTPHPEIRAVLGFSGDRLDVIEFESEGLDALGRPILARWGYSKPMTNSWSIAYEWPADTSGWVATLRMPPPTDTRASGKRAYLTLRAETAKTDARKTLVLDAGMLRVLAKLPGKSLDAADAALGAPLSRETSDDDADAAERGDPRQGFAIVTAPWSTYTWELVARTDAKGTIVELELTGETNNEEERVALMTAMQTAYGPPRPVISAAGRHEIEHASGGVIVRSRETDPGSWLLVLRRR